MQRYPHQLTIQQIVEMQDATDTTPYVQLRNTIRHLQRMLRSNT